MPVTMVVWFGQVQVGLMGCIDFAQLPFFMRSRRVGIGSFGSSRSYAGNPSRLIRTTVRSLAAIVPCPRASLVPGMNWHAEIRIQPQTCLILMVSDVYNSF